METGITPEQIQDLINKMPKDVAEGFFAKMKLEADAQEAKRITSEICGKVWKLLKDHGEALLEAIPAGRTLTIFHRAGLPAKDGQPAVEPELVFNIETSSSQTSTGSTRTREGGKLIRCTLDGKIIEGNTWRGALDKVNEALDPKDRCKIPDGAFSANRQLNDFAKKLNKASGKERLVVVLVEGEAAPATPAAVVPPPAPAPEGPAPTPDAPKS